MKNRLLIAACLTLIALPAAGQTALTAEIRATAISLSRLDLSTAQAEPVAAIDLEV